MQAVNKKLTDEDLDRAEDDPNNIVYRWVDSAPIPADQIIAPDDAARIINALMGRKHVLKHTYPKITQSQMNHLLKNENPEWEKFSKTNIRFFEECARLDSGEEERKVMVNMTQMYKIRDRFHDPREALREYVWNTFKMTPEEYKKKFGQAPRIVSSEVPKEFINMTR
jgi:hypothetical protein